MRVFLSLSAPKEGRGRPRGGGRRAAQRGSRERSRASRWTGAVDPRPLAASRLPLFPQSSPALAWRESPWSRRAEVVISEGCRLLERKRRKAALWLGQAQ